MTRYEPLSNPLVLVLLEAGATLPPGISMLQGRAGRAAIEAQQVDESMEDFARRQLKHIKDLRTRGEELYTAVLACGDEVGLHVDIARLRIAQSLLPLLSGSAEIVLSASQPASDETRLALMSLAGTLCESLGGTDIRVRVQFVEPPPVDSGFPESVPMSSRDSMDHSALLN